MTEQTSSPADPPAAGASTGAPAGPPAGATMTEPPISPYDAPPPGYLPPGGPAGAYPPAAPRQRFRDRVMKLWHALAVGAACLVVGLGFGVLIGHQTAGSGSDQFRPGVGQGPGGQGFRQGQGPGGQGFGQGQDGQSGTQSDGQPGTSS